MTDSVMNEAAVQTIGKTTRGSDRRSPTAGNRGHGSKWLRAATRLRIYARDGWRCMWCCAEVASLNVMMGIRLASIDHVVPRSRGGSNKHANLITACTTCNAKRGRRSVPAFARAVWAPGTSRSGGDDSVTCIRRVRAAQRRKLSRAR